MVVTVCLSGIPKFVELNDIAANLDNMFGDEEIGSFRVRDVTKNREKPMIALDFRSGYDAMYAQNLLHRKEYTLCDGQTVVMRAKLSKDPDLRAAWPLPSSAESHSDAEPTTSRPMSTNKKIHQADKEMNANLDVLEKKKKLLYEQELLREHERIKRELSQLPETEQRGSKKRHRTKSSDRDYREIPRPSDLPHSSRELPDRPRKRSKPLEILEFSPDRSNSRKLTGSSRKRSRSRELLERLQRNSHSIEPLEFSPNSSRSRKLSEKSRKSSRSRQVSESSQIRSSSRELMESSANTWNLRKVSENSQYDPRSRELQERSRKRSRSREQFKQTPKYHCSSENPKDLYYRKFKDSSSKSDDKYSNPDITRHSRSSMYHNKHSYEDYKKISKPDCHTKVRNIKNRSYTSESYRENDPQRKPSKDKEIHRHKDTIDKEHKEKQGALNILNKETASATETPETSVKDKAIKQIMMDSELLFNELFVKYKVEETEKKILMKKVLAHLFAVIDRRMQMQDISCTTTVADLVSRYRAKYTKMKDIIILDELFSDFVSTRDDKELDSTSSKADNIWSVVDQVLEKFDPALLTEEDVKPKIEIPEQITTITINLNVISSTREPSNTPHENESQQESTNKCNIKIDPDRKNKYYIPIKVLLQKMKVHIDTYTPYLDFYIFNYVIRGILEKRLDEILKGEPYMKAAKVINLYRDFYPQTEDHDFVLKVLYDIWEGRYNDADDNTADALVNVKAEKVSEETKQAPGPEIKKDIAPIPEIQKDKELETEQVPIPKIKKDKDEITEQAPVPERMKDKGKQTSGNEATKDTMTDKKTDRDNRSSKDSIITAAVKTEQNKNGNTESSTDNLIKLENDDQIGTVTSIPQTPEAATHDNDIADVMLVESKVEVIDLSDIGDDFGDCTQAQGSNISMNKPVKEEVATDNDVIYLSDNFIEIIDLETNCPAIDVKPYIGTIPADDQNQIEADWGCHRLSEKNIKIFNEGSQSQGHGINVKDDDTASLDTVILCEDAESNSSLNNEQDDAIEELNLQTVNIKNETNNERNNNVNMTNISV